MKNVIRLIAPFAALFTLACAKSPGPDSGRLYQVYWPADGGGYSLQSRPLPSLTQPRELKGVAAELLINPTLGADGLVSPGTLARYVDDGQTWIPANYATLQGLTIYAHMDELSRIDQKTGAANAIFGAPKVGFFEGTEIALFNNALYAHLDFFIFGDYIGSGVPISMNAGVIAHEHFHRIFQHLVHIPLKARSSRPWQIQLYHEWSPGGFAWGNDSCGNVTDYNQFLMRGFNEGLADYWGWIYTGDSNFIGPSLPDYSADRQIEGSVSNLSDEIIRAEYYKYVKERRCHQRSPYIMGSRVAKWMKSVAQSELISRGVGTQNREARIEIAARLIKSLPNLVSEIDRTPYGAELKVADVMRTLVEGNQSTLSCQIYKNQFGTARKPQGCQ